MQHESSFARLQVGHWNQDSAFKAPQRSYVELPRHICSRKDRDPLGNAPNLVHLAQKLSFNSALRFAFIAGATPTQRIHFVKQDDAWRVLNGQFKQENKSLLALPDVLARNVTHTDPETGCI